MEPPKKRSAILRYMTPISSIERAVGSLSRARDCITQSFNSMKNKLPDQSVDGKYPEGDLRNIKDSAKRYQAMYELHDWTPDAIALQRKTLRRTKMVAFIFSIISFLCVVILAIKTPIWISVLLIPLSGITLILGVAQGFKYALYETQIDLCEFISAREFASRQDFWNRLLG